MDFTNKTHHNVHIINCELHGLYEYNSPQRSHYLEKSTHNQPAVRSRAEAVHNLVGVVHIQAGVVHIQLAGVVHILVGVVHTLAVAVHTQVGAVHRQEVDP